MPLAVLGVLLAKDGSEVALAHDLDLAVLADVLLEPKSHQRFSPFFPHHRMQLVQK